MYDSFIIAIVGRPNVGKSRLFNRLSSSTQAIVRDEEGVTRDRQYARGVWYDHYYTVIDTGGFLPATEEPLLVSMRLQANLAIEEADAILFVMDGRAGLTPGDREIARMLRETEKPVFHIVNKVDTTRLEGTLLADFYQLGVELYPLSAEHGLGSGDIMDAVAEYIPKHPTEEEPPSPFARVCVVGRPNVGKSSLINRLLGRERLLTSDMAGTTRDAVDTTLQRDDGTQYMMIDTAGLRRKKNIDQQLEQASVVQAIRSIDRSDVALLVVDAEEGLTSQDKKIAGVIANRGRACVILVNKWDLVAHDPHTIDTWREALYAEMPFMHWAPIQFISALTGKRTDQILDLVDAVFERFIQRVQTSHLNQFLERAVDLNPPPVRKNRRLKFYYTSQVATRPPAFVFMTNYPDVVPKNYRRYLENQLRQEFDFDGTPVRIMMRARRRRE